LDTATLQRRGCPLGAAVQALLGAGAEILQVRHKGHWSRDFFREAEHAAELCSSRGVQLVVNDRADFALLLNAGLHVGQDDLPPSDAHRLIGAERILGLSTHNAEQLTAAVMEPVDYLALGPIFSTSSKEHPDPEFGLEKLRSWRGIAVGFPLVAIGGITRANALSVIEAGADSVAVIGDLLPEKCTELTLAGRFEEWLRLVGK
jgi:thiamine-phosphate pyrophosphorylase